MQSMCQRREMYYYKFNISDEAYKYLYVQRGAISDVKGREQWEIAYNIHTDSQYELMRDYLPQKCNTVLDIGSGLGGINVLINRHYGGKPHFELLDGKDDEPVVIKHKQTFNNHKVSERFLLANGLENFTLSTPSFQTGLKKDLIISMNAFMFHIPPWEYYTLLESSLKPGTVCIFKVRRSTDYLEYIRGLFKEIRVIKRLKNADVIYLRS